MKFTRALLFWGSLLPVSLLQQNAWADVCSDFGVKPSGNYVAPDPAGLRQIYLYTQSFFDLRAGKHAFNEPSFKKIADEVAAEMKAINPAAANPEAPVTDHLRAVRAQWAFVLANRLAGPGLQANKTIVFFEPCEFDFTRVNPHPDGESLAKHHRLLLPKLIINRSNVSVRSPDLKTKATLYHSGSSAAAPICRKANPALGHSEVRECRGRVILFANPGSLNLQVLGLVFKGDHISSRRYDPTFIAHENNQALVDYEKEIQATGAARPSYNTAWAMVMLNGPKSGATQPNNYLVMNSEFRNINYRGLQFFRDATVMYNTFDSAYVTPQGSNPTKQQIEEFRFKQVCLSGADSAACKNTDGTPKFSATYAPDRTLNQIFDKNVGMGWGSGITQSQAPVSGAATTVSGNSFSQLLEGMVAERFNAGSKIENNTFDTLFDHAIYFAGAHVEGTRIASNKFFRTFSSALKFAAHSIRATGTAVTEAHFSNAENTLTSMYGLKNSQIIGNVFDENGEGAIFMVGTGNTIKDNSFGDTYRSGWYRRTIWPHIQMTTFGGGLSTSICGYFNHTKNNNLSGNKHSDLARRVEILLGRDPRASAGNDYTTGGNWELGCKKYELAPYFLRDDRESTNNRIEGDHHQVWVTDLVSSRFGVAGFSLTGTGNIAKRCVAGENFYKCSGRTGE